MRMRSMLCCAGLSFDEGEFGVFGYVTKGMDTVVPRLHTGDIIISARLIAGQDKLVRPAPSPENPASSTNGASVPV